MRSKRKNNALFPVILFAIVIVAIIVGLAIAGRIRKERIDHPVNVTSQDQIPRLTGLEAKDALFNGNNVILIDTRDAAQFNQQHVKGAINIPVFEIESRLSELDKENWYLTYCT